MDFGDSISAIVIRIIQEKFLAKLCKLDLTKQVILFGAYADNYNSSLKTKMEYMKVKQDMEDVHEQIGLSLKNKDTAVYTDGKILDKTWKGERGKSKL